MVEPIIAIILDFDDTLGPDTISFLLTKYDINPKDFWEKINREVKKGWDPPQAYMNRILQYVQHGPMADLTKQRLQDLGRELPLFPGLPDALEEFKRHPWKLKEFKEAGIRLEFYIITGGLEEIIRGTPIAKYINGIFGCNFEYDSATNLPIAIKSTISFTEKTKYVFAINKGISEIVRVDPYRVNDAISPSERKISFRNMIYIGDGPSDIPCFSLIDKSEGVGIGVCPPEGSFKKGYELAEGERTTIGPYTANYTKGSDMHKALEQAIISRCNDILLERRKQVRRAPSH